MPAGQDFAAYRDLCVFDDIMQPAILTQIEREVRIAEAQQALGNDSVTALMPSAAEAVGRTEAVESEVDAILRSGF